MEWIRGVTHYNKGGKDAKQLDRSGPNLAHKSGNGHELKINPLIPEGHGGLGGHHLTNLGKLPNRPGPN